MQPHDNLGSFFRNNKAIVKDYVGTRLDILRLQGVRVLSKSLGLMIWILIASFLGLIALLFGGLVLAFWLSDLTQSYVRGFGYTALIFTALLVLLALFRNPLFINPIIRKVIAKSQESSQQDDENKPTNDL